MAVAIFAMGALYSTEPPLHESAKQQGTEQTNHEAAKIAADERIARYTWWLAVLTGALVGVSLIQGYFLLRSDKTARIAATAAERSARAAIGQKLPILRCKAPHLWPSPNKFHSGSFMGIGNPTTDDFIKILELNIFNHGETIAYPREYGMGWLFTTREPTEKEVLPPEPDYSDVYPINQEVVIKDTFTTPRIFTFCLMPSDEMKAGIKSGAGTLRLCAYIKYVDFLDDTHEARFCWRWEFPDRAGRGAGLVRDGLAPEAYTRKT